MDLSDLPKSVLRRLAEAEVEAKFIVQESEFLLGDAKSLFLEDKEADPGPRPDEYSQARNRAALHLFHAAAAALWERMRPDLGVFKARLASAKKWVDANFHPDADVLNKAAAFERKLARRELKENRTATKQRERPRVGVLAAAAMRRQQALREGLGLEGYLDSSSGAQTSAPIVPRGLGGSLEALTIEPLVRITIALPQKRRREKATVL